MAVVIEHLGGCGGGWWVGIMSRCGLFGGDLGGEVNLSGEGDEGEELLGGGVGDDGLVHFDDDFEK